jgi:predicted SAM-dependent methyltransferase
MHRVLEHVIDDFTALAELHRVLRPGGTLNISVPEALYLQKTMDWLVPDPRVHHHYRMYGRDFQALLLKAGFDAERSEYLLKLQPDQLKSLGAYPMLIYVARKA